MRSYLKLLSVLLALTASCAILASCTKNTPADTGTATDTSVETTDSLNDNVDGYYGYISDENGTTLLTYTGAETDLVVPSEVDGKPVTGIGDNLFRKRFGVKTVVIPDGITRIGEGAFAECSAIESITVPASVKEIGASAFADTPWFESLSDEFVTVGDSVVIKYNGSESSVTIPAEAKYVSNLFRYTKTDVVEVTLSDGNTVIGDRAFAGLKALEKVNISSTVTKISNNAFTLCTALKEITVPENVTVIDEYAFSHCKALTAAFIKGQIKVLEPATFYGCDSLESVELPASLEVLKTDSLTSCDALRKVVFAGESAEISEGAIDENPSFFVYCPEGSAIEDFCISHNIAVNPD